MCFGGSDTFTVVAVGGDIVLVLYLCETVFGIIGILRGIGVYRFTEQVTVSIIGIGRAALFGESVVVIVLILCRDS